MKVYTGGALIFPSYSRPSSNVFFFVLKTLPVFLPPGYAAINEQSLIAPRTPHPSVTMRSQAARREVEWPPGVRREEHTRCPAQLLGAATQKSY